MDSYNTLIFLSLSIVGTVLVIFVTYTILKHRLFNMKVFVVGYFSFFISLIFLIQFLTSSGGAKRVISGSLFIMTVLFGIKLVKSTIKDIEDRKYIEALGDDLVVVNEQLRQKDKQKSDFISIASHQLRTPLTAIKGYSSLILEGSFGDVADKPREEIQKIFEASQRMVMIVENFLTMSSIERGRMFYKFEVLDLQKISKEVVEEMRVVADEHGIELRFNEDTGSTYPVRADNTKIRQVVHNLLDDSIRHTQEGFVTVSLSCSQHGDHITLAISDTGKGATREKLKQLFRKCESDICIDKTHKETGAELFIAKEIVKAHRGKIWAESEGVGMGLTFFIELPQVKEKVLT